MELFMSMNTLTQQDAMEVKVRNEEELFTAIAYGEVEYVPDGYWQGKDG